jgi:hypothetical protein
METQFLFATGIENSNPTIQNGKVRVDELEKCNHYKFWKKDFDLVDELGIRFLRYGPPIHTTWLGVGTIGHLPTKRFRTCAAATSCPSWTCATSGCPTG